MTLTIILALGYPIIILGAAIMLFDYLRARDAAEREERAKLLVHIQAPEQALAERADSEEMLPAAIIENDDEWWEAKGYNVRETNSVRETR